jgi:hypothetical protein
MTLGRDQIREGHDDYHQCDDNQGGSRMLANGEAHTPVQSRLIVYAPENSLCREAASFWLCELCARA